MSTLNNLKYEIVFKKVKNINMRLRKDGVLVVSAPHGVSTDIIEQVLMKHYEKFYRAQQEMFEKNEVISLGVDNKTYTYIRGSKYELEFVKDTKFSYSIFNGKVTLYYCNQEKDYEKMIREVASKVFNELSLEVSSEMGLDFIEIEEKKFSRCFGKNYGRVNIALNYLLVHMDDFYIKHVLYHEYTHCLVFDHSKKFYDILSIYDKDHRNTKKYIGKNLHKFY